MNKANIFLKKHSSTILTCLGATGVISTTVLAIRATPKALQAIKNEENELTKLETAKVVLPAYIPTILSGTATIACIFGANILNKRTQASLVSAYTLLNNSYTQYKNKVEETYGKETHDDIVAEIAKDNYNGYSELKDENKLFFDFYSGRYFESTLDKVLMGEYLFNEEYKISGYACLNEFYDKIGLSRVDHGCDVGWSLEVGTTIYDYEYITFAHDTVIMDDGMECCLIIMTTEPTPDYLGF